MLDALRTHLGGSLAPGPADGGMHITVYLPDGTDEAAVIARGAERGMELRSLSRHYIGKEARPGLVLGYAGATPEQLRRAVALLAELLTPPRRAARNGPTNRRLIGA
jgi:GntR family transcriptional regulator/MocR family aminotransferase